MAEAETSGLAKQEVPGGRSWSLVAAVVSLGLTEPHEQDMATVDATGLLRSRWTSSATGSVGLVESR